MNHWVQNKRKKEKQQQQYNGIYDNKIKLLQILITVYGVNSKTEECTKCTFIINAHIIGWAYLLQLTFCSSILNKAPITKLSKLNIIQTKQVYYNLQFCQQKHSINVYSTFWSVVYL